jgi:hypothetical protein
MRPRQAHTLVELCVTMSVGSALLVLSTGLLHQALSLASTGRSRANQQRAINRLSHDFRHDVHLAADVSIVDPQGVDFTRDDGALVHYESIPDRWDRTRVRRVERVDGTKTRQEEYVIESPLVVVFETLNEPRRVAVTLTAQSSKLGPNRVPGQTIAAVLGRRLALQRAEVGP